MLDVHQEGKSDEIPWLSLASFWRESSATDVMLCLSENVCLFAWFFAFSLYLCLTFKRVGSGGMGVGQRSTNILDSEVCFSSEYGAAGPV